MPDQILSPDLLRYAYTQGIFPMADEDGEISWYLPDIRAIFPIDGFKVSTSLRKRLKNVRLPGEEAHTDFTYEVRFDTSYEQVMRSCLRPRDNWISEEIIEAYTICHKMGWGHCSEVWVDDELVGGVYGLAIGGAFFAESMFHRKTDCSKIALWALIEECKSQGFTLFDAQIMNPHLASLGAQELPNHAYQKALTSAMKVRTQWG